MPLIFKLLLIAVAIYAIGLAAMVVEEPRLVYLRNPEHVDPAALGLGGVREQVLDTPDGEKIVTWVAAAKPGKPTILYFHGNGGSLAIRDLRVKTITDAGYGLMMMAYRGYSGSTGSPSETALHADARLAYDTLIRQGVLARELVVYGESLGTGVAVKLATEVPLAAMVLDAPYTALPDVAALQFWFLPVRWLMRNRFDTLSRIKSVHAPLLILHGELDPVIPVAMGKAIYDAANDPKRIWIAPGGGHSNLFSLGAFGQVRKFLEGLAIARS